MNDTEVVQELVDCGIVPQDIIDRLRDDYGVRKCSICGRTMTSGFVIGGGDRYYCDNICLHRDFSPDEFEIMHENDPDENYYTEW